MYAAFNFMIKEYDIDLLNITIINGKCKTGADKMGELLAEAMDYPIKYFPADWNKHGKSAGVIRNEEMAIITDRALIFWDGKSKGTKDMINRLIKHKKPFTIIDY